MPLRMGGSTAPNRAILVASIWTTIGNLLARGFGAFSALALSALLGAASYGQYSLLLSTVALCAAIGQLGLQSIVTRDLARSTSRLRAVYSSTALAIMGAMAAITSLAVVGLSYQIEFLTPLREAAGGALFILIPWSVLWVCNNQAGAVLIGVYRFRPAALLSGFRGLVVGGLVIPLALWAPYGQVIYGAFLGEFVALAMTVYMLRKYGLLVAHISRDYVRRIFRVGAGAGAAALFIQSVTWGSQTFLANQPEGFVQVGIFALGLRLGLVASMLSNSMVTALLPYLSVEKGAIRWRRAVLLPVGVAAASALLTSASLPIVGAYWPQEYTASLGVLAIMMLLSVVSAANTSIGSYAVASGLLRDWVVSDLVLGAAMAALVLLLVPYWGALGLGLSQMAAYMLSAAFLLLRVSMSRGAT